MTRTTIRGKLFSSDPQMLQNFSDRIQNEIAPDCSVSRPLPTDKRAEERWLTRELGSVTLSQSLSRELDQESLETLGGTRVFETEVIQPGSERGPERGTRDTERARNTRRER